MTHVMLRQTQLVDFCTKISQYDHRNIRTSNPYFKN